jgi:hypothetical protein
MLAVEVTSLPEYLLNSTRSPFTSAAAGSVVGALPRPTAITLPSWGFSLAVSGMMIPPLVFGFLVDALDEDSVLERT